MGYPKLSIYIFLAEKKLHSYSDNGKKWLRGGQSSDLTDEEFELQIKNVT